MDSTLSPKPRSGGAKTDVRVNQGANYILHKLTRSGCPKCKTVLWGELRCFTVALSVQGYVGLMEASGLKMVHQVDASIEGIKRRNLILGRTHRKPNLSRSRHGDK